MASSLEDSVNRILLSDIMSFNVSHTCSGISCLPDHKTELASGKRKIPRLRLLHRGVGRGVAVLLPDSWLAKFLFLSLMQWLKIRSDTPRNPIILTVVYIIQ